MTQRIFSFSLSLLVCLSQRSNFKYTTCMECWHGRCARSGKRASIFGIFFLVYYSCKWVCLSVCVTVAFSKKRFRSKLQMFFQFEIKRFLWHHGRQLYHNLVQWHTLAVHVHVQRIENKSMKVCGVSFGEFPHNMQYFYCGAYHTTHAIQVYFKSRLTYNKTEWIHRM